MTAFHYAVFKGFIDTARALATLGADITAPDATGRTALHLACVSGWIDIAQWLVEQGLDASAVNAEGMSCAHFAALGGHLEVLEWLSGTCKVDLGGKSASGMSALHLACMKGHLEVAQWLTNQPDAAAKGLDIKVGDGKKRTPLHLAVVGSHERVVKWLLDSGASAKGNDADGKSSAQLAIAIASSGNAANQPAAEKVKEFLTNAIIPPAAPAAPVLLTPESASELGLLIEEGEVMEDEEGEATADGAGDEQPQQQGSDAAEAADADGPALDGAAAAPSIAPKTAQRLSRALPHPCHGATHHRVFIRWEEPHVPPCGLPVHEYQVQAAVKPMSVMFAPSWKDATLVGVTGGNGTKATTAASSDDTTDAPSTAAPAAGEVTSSSTPYPFACVTGLQPSTTYNFRVRARNGNGWGQWSGVSKDMATEVDKTPAAAPATPAKPSGDAAGDATAATTPAPPPAPPQPVIPVIEPTLSARAVECANTGDVEGLQAAADDGDDVSGVDVTFRSVVHHAANHGHVEVARWALSREAVANNNTSEPSTVTSSSGIIDARDRVGATPLLLAVVGGHLQMVKYLASKGASVDASDLKGYTALHYAALKGRVSIFRWLSEAGADTGVRNSKGQTPRDLLDARLAPGAAPPPAKEEVAAVTYMLNVLGSSDNLPSAPPPPVLVDASRFSVVVQLPPAKWVAGAPAPFAYELQFAKKISLSMFWTTASDSIPTGINVYAEEYLVPSKAGSKPAGTAGAATSAPAGSAAGDGAAAQPAGTDAPASAEGSSSAGDEAAPKPAPAPATASASLLTPVYYAITGLSPDTRYIAQVRARNARGWGPWSTKSLDLHTKATNDSYQIPADLLEAANATVQACTAVAAESGAAAAAGRRPGAAIFQSPSQLLAMSPQPRMYMARQGSEKGAPTDAGGGTTAKSLLSIGSSLFGRRGSKDATGAGAGATAAAVGTEARSRHGSDAAADGTGSRRGSADYDVGAVDVIPADGGGGAAPTSIVSALLTAAGEGRVADLLSHPAISQARSSVAAAVQYRMSSSGSGSKKGGASGVVDGALISGVLASTAQAGVGSDDVEQQQDTNALTNDAGAVVPVAQMYCKLASAAAMSGQVAVLRWLAGVGGDDVDAVQETDLTPQELQAILALSAAVAAGDADDGRSLVHAAALGGQIELLQSLVAGDKAAALLSARTKSGATTAHLAAFAGQSSTLEYLVSSGCDTGAGGGNGWCMSHWAAAGGNADVFRQVCEQHGQGSHDAVSAVDAQGRTPAHLAASCDAIVVLSHILTIGGPAALMTRDGAGLTPLHYAAAADARCSLCFLLQHCGARAARSRDITGRTPDDLAIECCAMVSASIIRGWSFKKGSYGVQPAGCIADRSSSSPSTATLSWEGSSASLLACLSGCTVPDESSLSQHLPELLTSNEAVEYEVQWLPLQNGAAAFTGPSSMQYRSKLVPASPASSSVTGDGSSASRVSATIDGLVSGRAYGARVRARRSDGTWSPFSDVVTA